jgi:hypothetical protein
MTSDSSGFWSSDDKAGILLIGNETDGRVDAVALYYSLPLQVAALIGSYRLRNTRRN